MPSEPAADEPKERITIEVRPSTLSMIEAFRHEWGLRSRAVTVERILDELFNGKADG